ncbi:3-oxoacyl-ACP reductase [Arthrobacter sp. VKM Ac-2550]|uniref:3-oxoacyl-ACP reductase n=1 Tax=Crystallibacter permensis TaxID=1938888 RepID=UPI002227D454|nr:3-oxoacyl-ACP reductase [Arthrobacter sp. VKM Ac-2550]MCW2133043.1 3-oxoacyl-[acyl-carrier protein] reductase [Arthrobacter sp. VKM Ac-2550]
MTDSYLTLVNTGLSKNIAKKLGLPRPAILRRYHPGQPLVPGPVLLIGSSAGTETLATELLAWGLDVRRHAGPKDKLGAIIAVLDEVSDPENLAEPMLAVGSSLRSLLPGGRVVTISRPASTADAPARAAARQGIEGALRSLAHELRGGATGNGILLDDAVDAQAPSALAALRFFLSGRSAYVDGQFLLVGSPQGELPADFDRPLAGQVAVVTGAARGIGAAIAKVLHRDGARVICVDVPAAGEQLAKVSNETGGTALQLDITSETAGQKILEHAHSRYGRLDIVVHNAGITRDKLLANMDEAKWNSVISVNIASQLRINEVLLASELFPQVPQVVSLASTSGIAGNRGQTNYAASKAGVIGMVAASAAAFAERGGTINAVAPGFIETEMTAKIPMATREIARRMLPSLQQGGLPLDVAETISFLVSDAAGGINGQTLRVCGQSLVGA